MDKKHLSIFLICVVVGMNNNLDAMELLNSASYSLKPRSNSSKTVSTEKINPSLLRKCSSEADKDLVALNENNKTKTSFTQYVEDELNNSIIKLAQRFPELKLLKSSSPTQKRLPTLNPLNGGKKERGFEENFSDFERKQDLLISVLEKKINDFESVNEETLKEIEFFLKPIRLVEQWKAQNCLRVGDIFTKKFTSLLEKIYKKQNDKIWTIYREKGDFLYNKACELVQETSIDDFLIESSKAFLRAYRYGDKDSLSNACNSLHYLLSLQSEKNNEPNLAKNILDKLGHLNKFESCSLLADLYYHQALNIQKNGAEKNEIATLVMQSLGFYVESYKQRKEIYYFEMAEKIYNDFISKPAGISLKDLTIWHEIQNLKEARKSIKKRKSI